MLICPRNDGGTITRRFEVRPVNRPGGGTREVETLAWCDRGHFLDKLGERPIEADDAD